jgi:outer membrane protein assembly factor BamB
MGRLPAPYIGVPGTPTVCAVVNGSGGSGSGSGGGGGEGGRGEGGGDESLVIVVGANGVAALRPDSGAVVWVSRAWHASILASASCGGGRLFVTDLDGNVTARALATGHVLWTTAVSVGDNTPDTPPSIDADANTIFVALNAGDPAGPSMVALNASTGEPLWSVSGGLARSHLPAPPLLLPGRGLLLADDSCAVSGWWT